MSTVVDGPDAFGSITRPVPSRAETTADQPARRRPPLLEASRSSEPTVIGGSYGSSGAYRSSGAFGSDRSPGSPGDRDRWGRSKNSAALAATVAVLIIGVTVALVSYGPDDESAAGLGQDVDRVVAGAPEQPMLPIERPDGKPLQVEGLARDSNEVTNAAATSTPEEPAVETTGVEAEATGTSAAPTSGPGAAETTASPGRGTPSSANTTGSTGPGGPTTTPTGRNPITSGPAASRPAGADRATGTVPTGSSARPATTGSQTSRQTTGSSARPATTGRATTGPETTAVATTRRSSSPGPTTSRVATTTAQPTSTSRPTSARPTSSTARPPTTVTPSTRTPSTTPAITTPSTTPATTTPATTRSTTTTTTTGGSPGRVVWEEQFNTLNTATWKLEHSTYGDGNNELQCYRPENVSVANGKLTLRAVTETYTCPNGSTRQVTSGMIRSQGVTFSPGQAIEFRVKLNPGDPNDQGGLWPAVWASGWAGGGWPRGGEMDWLEVMTAENPRRAMFSMHYENAAGNHALQNKGIVGSQYFSAAWHVIRFDYGRNGKLTWYLDGVEAFSVDSASTIQGYPAPFDQTVHEIKINLALGGRPGPLAPGAVGSQGASFEMDYIRILEL